MACESVVDKVAQCGTDNARSRFSFGVDGSISFCPLAGCRLVCELYALHQMSLEHGGWDTAGTRQGHDRDELSVSTSLRTRQGRNGSMKVW